MASLEIFLEIKKMIENSSFFLCMYSNVENIKRGEFVKRKVDSKRVFTRGEYCPASKRYALEAWDDISAVVYVPRGTVLVTGFEL